MKEYTKYSDKVATLVCQSLAEGKTLGEIASMEGMPSKDGILKWRRTREDFQKLYDEAMLARAHALWDEYENYKSKLETAQTRADVQKYDRLLNHLEWQMTKLLPRYFGDRIKIDQDQRPAPPAFIDDTVFLANRDVITKSN